MAYNKAATMKKARKMVRPGGRTERVRQSVANAVLALLAAGDPEFTLQEVARRSGVDRRTIHRRWGNRRILTRDILTGLQAEFHVEYTGQLQEDMRRHGRAFRDFCAKPHQLSVLMLMTSDRPEFAATANKAWAPIFDASMGFLRRAKQSAQLKLDADQELIVSMLQAPIVSEILFAKRIPSDAYIDKLVDYLVSSWAPAGSKGSHAKPYGP
jgi:AcrR family transcriptional regulator